MDYEDFFKQRLDALRAEGRYRVFADLERRCGRFPRAFDHRIGAEVTVWCSNDYLGMGQHPAVLAAMTGAHRRRSAPAPAAPATSPATATCISSSNANSPICTAARRRWSSPRAMSRTRRRCRPWRSEIPGTVVLSDALNHASMIAGIRNSRAEKQIFRHNDPDDLARRLAALPPERPKLVCFEFGLFDGRRHRADRRIVRRRRPRSAR